MRMIIVIIYALALATVNGKEEDSKGLVFPNDRRYSSVINPLDDQPKYDDLALSRLHSKVREIVNQIWTTILDQQRFAIFKGKGSLATGTLRIFSEIQGDVFAVDSMISNTGVERELRKLSNKDGDNVETWRMIWETVQKTTGKTNLLYSYFDSYMTQASLNENVSEDAILDYASSILQPGSDETSLISALVHLHKLSIAERTATNHFGRTKREDLFYILYETLKQKNGEPLCGVGQSPHQVIYNLYNVIALTEIKGYAMIQFSYMMLRLYGKGNFTVESDLARKSFESQATEKLAAIKKILPQMSREFWRCDPSQRQIEGVTYIRMTRLLQGFMENEIDMNPRKSCKYKCSTFTVTKTHGCYKDLFCAKQDKCTGRLFDCRFYHADSWVCMSNTPGRRYDWIEYEDHTLLGKKGQCINKIKVDSWWRWLFWHCSYCMCKCDQPGKDSDRYWSLKPVTSEVSENMIITGVRFVKKDRVIQMEIEQAIALPEGGVDETTRFWKQNETKFDVNDKSKKGVDFMEMSYEERALDTDKLEAPEGHVITGVRFRNLGGHINLEAQVTPIKFTTGELDKERSTWIGNDNTPATEVRRGKVDILMPDIPTNFKGYSTIDTKSNEYILFDATSADKDVMQTTIPYIDAQPVSPSAATWLTGVGLYHKGALGYGGYVGLTVSTFDFSKHLLPEKQKNGRSMKANLTYDFERNPIK